MQFVQTRVTGCIRVEIEPHSDERGLFARIFSEEEFAEAGLPVHFVQWSMSRNLNRGTTRGLHFQRPPSAEGKLVRCVRGSIFDVALDIRPESPSYLRHVAVRLDADGVMALYIPPGCAHGFQTLEDGSDVLYAMSDVYRPDLAEGLRWNDPRFGIDWPLDDVVMNARDAAYPDIDENRLASFDWREVGG